MIDRRYPHIVYSPPPPDCPPCDTEPQDDLTDGLEAARGIYGWFFAGLAFWAVVGFVVWRVRHG